MLLDGDNPEVNAEVNNPLIGNHEVGNHEVGNHASRFTVTVAVDAVNVRTLEPVASPVVLACVAEPPGVVRRVTSWPANANVNSVVTVEWFNSIGVYRVVFDGVDGPPNARAVVAKYHGL